MMRCPKPECQYALCFNCKEAWHADVTCAQYQKWKEENAHANDRYDEWRKKNTKNCPQCKTPIEKNGGCNHMKCINCKYEYCWLCFEKYKSGHFTLDEKGKCYGKQYT